MHGDPPCINFVGTINAKEKAQLVDASLHEFTNQVTISVDRLTHTQLIQQDTNYQVQRFKFSGSNSVYIAQSTMGDCTSVNYYGTLIEFTLVYHSNDMYG